MDALEYHTVPFFAGDTLPAMQYFDEQVEAKTGVSRASMGLDPEALQNTSATAVNAMNAAATGRVELFARNLAEGGLKTMFRLMLQLVRQHADGEQFMRLNGQFVPVDPRSWSTKMDMTVNVGLGTGGEVEKEMVLRELLQQSIGLYTQLGPHNGVVSLTGIRNILAEIAKLGGINNVDRYIGQMDHQTEMQLLQAAEQAQMAQMQGQGDPNAAFLQAEQIKAQSKMQGDMVKAQLDAQKLQQERELKIAEMLKNDDLERDEMAQDLLVKAAEILGQYGAKVDVSRIQAEQNKPRYE